MMQALMTSVDDVSLMTSARVDVAGMMSQMTSVGRSSTLVSCMACR